MLTPEALQELREQVAQLNNQALADEQTLAILQANLTLVMDRAQRREELVTKLVARGKEAVGEAQAAVAKLKEIDRIFKDVIAEGRADGMKTADLEATSKDVAHRLASLRSAITATLDYLDRVEPTTVTAKGTA